MANEPAQPRPPVEDLPDGSVVVRFAYNRDNHRSHEGSRTHAEVYVIASGGLVERLVRWCAAFSIHTWVPPGAAPRTRLVLTLAVQKHLGSHNLIDHGVRELARHRKEYRLPAPPPRAAKGYLARGVRRSAPQSPAVLVARRVDDALVPDAARVFRELGLEVVFENGRATLEYSTPFEREGVLD